MSLNNVRKLTSERDEIFQRAREGRLVWGGARGRGLFCSVLVSLGFMGVK